MKIKLGDILVIISVAALACLILISGSKDGDTVIIEANGAIVKTLALDIDAEYTFKGEYTNIVTVENGCAYVSFSDCPDNTCVHSGKVDSSGRIICCLPNKLIIRVEKRDIGSDVISG